MSNVNGKLIIENFYKYFNALDLEKLFELFSDDIAHQINYGELISGKIQLIKYIKHILEHYEEHVSEYVLMVSNDGRCITTKIITNGKYIKTDESSIPAKGQTYMVTAFNYFEIENNKIIKALCFFDENDLEHQLTKK